MAAFSDVGVPVAAAPAGHDPGLALLAAIWLLGVCAIAMRLFADWRTLRRVIRDSLPAPQALTAILERELARIGLRRRVRLRLTGSYQVPGVYGMLRPVILMPVALAIAAWFHAGPQGTAMAVSWPQALFIALSGLMTGVPLMMFAEAARRLPYTVVGFIQFASPTIVFLLGLFYFGEELYMAQLAAFIAIWIAAGLFTWDLLRARRPVSARA